MKYPIALAAVLSLSLIACDRAPREAAPEPVETGAEDPDAEPTAEPTASIFSPEAELPVAVELESLTQTIGFPAGGSDFDAEALAAIETILDSPQIGQGQAIVLRGHSDADGTDAVNLRASQTRAEAVRDLLVSKGIAESRIRLIAFGEQNPVAPNALPDGTPNEEGRAQNRRVDVTVRVKTGGAPPEAAPATE
ncbi:OmpA family protein [Altererythrobacter sp. ZODW24]|uniref:OmpA family protein n=1 Tax=Altererythrobacter sp. ZODW24 TaxID=2185142 RepID=UPI0013B424A9|nr:OmpA family protein [Altererythrobacter sp. ZODW24]